MTDHEQELRSARAYHDNLRQQLAELQERFNEQHRFSRSVRAEAKSLAHYGARKFNEKNDRIKQLEGLLRESQERISTDWIARRDAALAGGAPSEPLIPCQIHECAACGLSFVSGDTMLQITRAMHDTIHERFRQVMAEGWTLEHDDEHDSGDLSAAAVCYAANACSVLHPQDGLGIEDIEKFWMHWPWDPTSWKPKSPREDLVRATALLIAEIEKLDRLEAKNG